MTIFKPSFGVDADELEFGDKVPIDWDFEHQHHVLVCGKTGSGKTMAVKSILSEVALSVPQAQVLVCDYKADDFKFLNGCKRYYSFDKCFDGLMCFYNMFKKRQSGEDPTRNFRLLLFDEWASWLTSLEKKEAEEAKKILSILLMLGRSFNVHVLISQQRADAKYFDTARDNFSVILALGNLSRESVQMFFSEYKDEMRNDKGRGTGHILLDDIGLKHIIIPQIRDINKLHNCIYQLVN